MKIISGALAAVVLAGISWSMPAQAQGMPGGTYLRSCTNVAMSGDGLIATCRRADGREQRSILADARRCAGDIGNNNGILQCQHASGRQAFGQVVAEPGVGGPRYGEPPGYGYGSERRAGGEAWERCRGLQRESEELRARLDREWNPLDRARTEGRLREVHEQQERCRY